MELLLSLQLYCLGCETRRIIAVFVSLLCHKNPNELHLREIARGGFAAFFKIDTNV